jgi:hypothetical protein
MKIELLYFEDCPNRVLAVEGLRATIGSLGREDQIHEVEVRTQAQAEALRFVGSPTIRINGSDIEPWAHTAKSFGLSCRTYTNGSVRTGVPTLELLRRAIMEGIHEGG